MPRFVILEHDWPERHWDLMLEAGDVLRTWRLASPPEPGQSVSATAIGDHRPHYLDYEGPVSGNRGTVKRWDAGVCTWLTDAEGCVSVRLDGTRCCGTATLVQQENNEWSFAY